MNLPLAIVTGASGGIGQAVVRDLADTHRVVAIGRDRAKLEHLPATPLVWDMEREPIPAELKALSREPIDALIHCAARATKATLAAAEQETWEADFNLNVIMPAMITRELLPGLKDAGGTVVFINSGAGVKPHAGLSVYVATKHALNGLAGSLRLEEPDIRVSTVSPGPTDTPMLKSLRGEDGYEPARFLAPQAVAEAVRMVVEAHPSAQLTDVMVRPRQE